MPKIVGYIKLKGTSRKTGRPYDGYSLHCTDEPQGKDFVGDSVLSTFVPVNVLDGEPYLGAEADFRYDARGYLRSVVIR